MNTISPNSAFKPLSQAEIEATNPEFFKSNPSVLPKLVALQKDEPDVFEVFPDFLYALPEIVEKAANRRRGIPVIGPSGMSTDPCAIAGLDFQVETITCMRGGKLHNSSYDDSYNHVQIPAFVKKLRLSPNLASVCKTTMSFPEGDLCTSTDYRHPAITYSTSGGMYRSVRFLKCSDTILTKVRVMKAGDDEIIEEDIAYDKLIRRRSRTAGDGFTKPIYALLGTDMRHSKTTLGEAPLSESKTGPNGTPFRIPTCMRGVYNDAIKSYDTPAP